MNFTTGESKVVAGILRTVVGFCLAVLCFGLADKFGDQERHAHLERAKLLGHIAADSGLNLGDLDDFKQLDRPGAVARSATGTAIAAEQAVLSDLDSEIDRSQENERWSLGGAGATGLVGLGGVFELVRASGRRKRTGLERWWSDDVPN